MTATHPDSLNSTATLLPLLQSNARITFQDSTYMQGDNDTGYIEVGTEFGSEGLWSLDEAGVTNALGDLKKIRAQLTDENQ